MASRAVALKNDRFIRALKRQPVDVTPIWIMRQAGRYLPEYRAVRQKAGSFMSLCTNPELACEVTLQPLRRFPLDAAILFSDILTIPDAMGMGLYFEEGEGPKFKRSIKNEADILALDAINPEQGLSYVMDAVRLIVKELNAAVPLIGFSGSPWTLATYMVEGGSSRDFGRIKQMLYQSPALLHHLLSLLADSVEAYLFSQIMAGVSAIQIFDTWGGVLTTDAYKEFSLSYMTRIIRNLKRRLTECNLVEDVPVILFTKGGGGWLELMVDSGCDALGLDWTVDIGAAKERVGRTMALQGNMDPCVLLGTRQGIETEVAKILSQTAGSVGHVFNLGHGIWPTISTDNVGYLVDAVHAYPLQQK